MSGITKTTIKERTKRKTNPEVAEAIILARKNEAWMDVARILARPTRKIKGVNLERIDKETKEGDTVIIPGKVLGMGEITKKIRIAASGFSEIAKEKLKKNKCETVTIIEEINKNPKAQGIKIIAE